MLSIIIPTLNAASGLPRCLESLLEGVLGGLVAEVILSDGGSADPTIAIGEAAGAKIVAGARGRGPQLAAGAAVARGDWLLFLHSDTALDAGWASIVEQFTETAPARTASVFRLAFNARGVRPWVVAAGANMRAAALRLPYGDQGLLMSRQHYDSLGGYGEMPLFEDVDMVRRLTKEGGRGALRMLPVRAITSADRYEADGYVRRVWKNFRCLRAYLAGEAPEAVAERYYGKSTDAGG